jgi:hypothetical protein
MIWLKSGNPIKTRDLSLVMGLKTLLLRARKPWFIRENPMPNNGILNLKIIYSSHEKCCIFGLFFSCK